MSFGCFLFGEKKTPQHSIYSASQNKRFFLLLTETNGNRFDLLRGPELLKYQEWIIHNRTFIPAPWNVPMVYAEDCGDGKPAKDPAPAGAHPTILLVHCQKPEKDTAPSCIGNALLWMA